MHNRNMKFVSSHILYWCLGSHKRPALLMSLPTAKMSAVRCIHFTSLTSRKQWGLSGQRDGKAFASQTSLVSEPSLNQFEASVRVRSTFLTDAFVFLCRKFTFGGPETGSEKKSFKPASSHNGRTNRFELDLKVARTHFEHPKTQTQSRNDSNQGP